MNKTSATHKLQAQLAEGKPVKGGSGNHGKKIPPSKAAKLAHAKSASKPAPGKTPLRLTGSKGRPQSKPRVKRKAHPAKAAAKRHKK